MIDSAAIAASELQIALATLAHIRTLNRPLGEMVEIVCTAPDRLGVPLRTTLATALELVQEATLEVLVVGYVFTTGAGALVQEMARGRRERRVRVTLIGNRMEDHLLAIRSMWPTASPEPLVYTFQADPQDHMTALHAKLLICDARTALITSANFSYHGLHENIEIGVRVQSPTVARLVEFFQALIRVGQLMPVEWH
jgi:phosphatidylserine/phosphatidylglycerophosphate/cardiolipin synthase-like enzyme